jgi:hypothetical protein
LKFIQKLIPKNLIGGINKKQKTKNKKQKTKNKKQKTKNKKQKTSIYRLQRKINLNI